MLQMNEEPQSEFTEDVSNHAKRCGCGHKDCFRGEKCHIQLAPFDPIIEAATLDTSSEALSGDPIEAQTEVLSGDTVEVPMEGATLDTMDIPSETIEPEISYCDCEPKHIHSRVVHADYNVRNSDEVIIIEASQPVVLKLPQLHHSSGSGRKYTFVAIGGGVKHQIQAAAGDTFASGVYFYTMLPETEVNVISHGNTWYARKA